MVVWDRGSSWGRGWLVFRQANSGMNEDYVPHCQACIYKQSQASRVVTDFLHSNLMVLYSTPWKLATPNPHM